MPVAEYQRVTATNPGKHGPKDWRVDFSGRPPTIAELIFMLGMFLLAEDRYDKPWHQGRYRLWYYVRQLVHCRNPDDVAEVAEAANRNVESAVEKRRPL